jgi:hypothetical protein
LLAESHGYPFLATVDNQSGPRLHPVAPIMSSQGLFIAVHRGSPKVRDIYRDPRIALHSTVVPPDDEEFSVRGLAHEVVGESVRAASVAGASGGAQLSDELSLFEVDLVEVGWAWWELGKPTRLRWASGSV